jgi:protein-tyrosine-phosphatase
MAEYLMKRRLPANSPWTVTSAGVHATPGMPASATAVMVMRELSVDISMHRSKSATREWVDAASIVVVMTTSHSDTIRTQFPHVREKVFLLRSFDLGANGKNVADPIGGSVSYYRETRNEIDKAITGLLTFLKTLERTELEDDLEKER